MSVIHIFAFIPEWLTVTNFLIAVFGFVTLIAGAIVVLILRKGSEVSSIQVDRATAAEALVKTKDSVIVSLEQRCADLDEELESVTAEHRTLAGISIAELMRFWEQKEAFEAQMEDLRSENRVLRRRKDGDI